MALSVDSLIQTPELSARQLVRGRSLGNIAVSTEKQHDRLAKAEFSKQLQRERAQRKEEYNNDDSALQNSQNTSVAHENRVERDKSVAHSATQKSDDRIQRFQQEKTENLVSENKYPDTEAAKLIDEPVANVSVVNKGNRLDIQQLISTPVTQNSGTAKLINTSPGAEVFADGSQSRHSAVDGNKLPLSSGRLPLETVNFAAEDVLSQSRLTEKVINNRETRLNALQQQLKSPSGAIENQQQSGEGKVFNNLKVEQSSQPISVSTNFITETKPELPVQTLQQLNDKIRTIISSAKQPTESLPSEPFNPLDSSKLVSADKLSLNENFSNERLLKLLTEKSQQSLGLSTNLLPSTTPSVIKTTNDHSIAFSGLNLPQTTTATLTDLNGQLPVTYQMRTSVQSPAWSGNFAQNIVQMTLNNRNLAEIRLDPPELGSIMVKIHQQASDAMIQFHVQHTDAKAAIENSLFRLKEALAQQGFAQVDVDVQQQSSQYSQNRQTQNDSTVLNTHRGRDGTETEPALPSSVNPVYLELSTGIDLFA